MTDEEIKLLEVEALLLTGMKLAYPNLQWYFSSHMNHSEKYLLRAKITWDYTMEIELHSTKNERGKYERW